jgi:hypothetical protein
MDTLTDEIESILYIAREVMGECSGTNAHELVSHSRVQLASNHV